MNVWGFIRITFGRPKLSNSRIYKPVNLDWADIGFHSWENHALIYGPVSLSQEALQSRQWIKRILWACVPLRKHTRITPNFCSVAFLFIELAPRKTWGKWCNFEPSFFPSN